MKNYNKLIQLVFHEVEDIIKSLVNPSQRSKDVYVENGLITAIASVFKDSQTVFNKPEYKSILQTATAIRHGSQKIPGETLYKMCRELYDK